MSAYGAGKSKDTDFRRTWDKAEYAERAAQREAKERLNAINADRKKRGLPPLKDKNEAPEQPKTMLKHREEKVVLDSNVGKMQIVTGGTDNKSQPGFYCDLCDSVFKDSKGYIDHINGRRHQSKLGVSMKVERSSVSSVKDRLEALKRKKEEPESNREYDLQSRVEELKQQEHDEKRRRKEQKRLKKEEKQKQIQDSGGDEEDEMAKLMGFGSFGSSKVS
ncbi:hypothetical protein BCR42DRAFT_407954 [Absidia repens]|uniref:Matrin-type domain-containing protein n=1 Tax=Absidia repens TaxID=90262 RepID=A0A1X2ISW1_9FUNG|nr:hypothetical protein BCR42DRAFT_407954 [Absidia repens]